jgi:hypothetical protein
MDTLGGVLCAPCAKSLAEDRPERIVGPISAEIPCYNCGVDGRHCLCHAELTH